MTRERITRAQQLPARPRAASSRSESKVDYSNRAILREGLQAGSRGDANTVSQRAVKGLWPQNWNRRSRIGREAVPVMSDTAAVPEIGSGAE